jgi:hypothetical protein
MTQPIHQQIPATEGLALQQSKNQRDIKITLIAMAAIASFTSILMLPWPISLPISIVLMAGALAYSTDYHPQATHSSTFIVQPPPVPVAILSPEPVYYMPPPPVFAPSYHHRYAPAVRAPVGTAQITPIVPSRCPERPHVPVGTGMLTRLVPRPCFGHAPDSAPALLGQSAWGPKRVPVGHR